MFKVKDDNESPSIDSENLQFKAPRGMSDILPEDHSYFTFIKKVARHRCRQAGFQRITTPICEATDLFTRGAGESSDIVTKEMYTFEDKGGRSLTLRPEGTAATMRSYLENKMYVLPQPVKLFYIEPMFRYERPQVGRYRQHWQFGVEIIGGENDPVIDAQIISLGNKILTDLGLGNDTEIQLNSVGCPECRPRYREELINYYSEKQRSLCEDCRNRFEQNPLRLLDCKNEDCQILLENAPKSIDYLCDECKEHFTKLQEFMKILGLSFTVNPNLVRGLDYYTKTVFEFWDKTKKGQSTLIGGGRYDNLAEELGGARTSAIGFSSGMERFVIEMKERKIGVPHKDKVQVFVGQLGHEAKKICLPLISELRNLGIHTMNSLGQSSLKVQLKQADKLDAEWAIIIGEMEVRQGTALLRDMRIGEQQIVPFDQVIPTILNIFPEEVRDTYTPGELKFIEEGDEEENE